MTSSRITVRSIERGVRLAKSHSAHRSPSLEQHALKHQMAAFVDHSHVEKTELSQLNERMSQYVHRVKALESENKRLLQSVDEAQLSWGGETREVREKYEQSLFDARQRIDDVANLKTVADVRNKRAQYEHAEYQKRADAHTRLADAAKTKIESMEREVAQQAESRDMYERSVADVRQDIEKHKVVRDETWANLVDLLDKLDDELYRRIAVEYNNQTLREHIEFIRQINEVFSFF